MAGEVYAITESTLWFVPAAATQPEDAAFEVASLGNGAGRQSAQLDRGTSARAVRFRWRAFVQFAAAPVVSDDNFVRVLLKTAGSSASATAHPDNDDGTTEGAVSAEDKLKNLLQLGNIRIDQAAAGVEMVASGELELRERAFQVVFWNNSGVALAAGVNDSGFMLTPVPDQVQS